MDYGNLTVFETSWEVCNKVGGIYTVVSSKALQATDNFGDSYWLLGPDLGNNPQEFEEGEDSLSLSVRKILDAHNLHCRVGKWKIPGQPRVILVDFKDAFDQNQLLYTYWKNFGVDSMSGGWDYIEPVTFASACGEVIATIYRALIEPVGTPAIAHFHEWMCGAGILYLKYHCPAIGTVFTTHATMLGRSMCGNGKDLYGNLQKQFDAQSEAIRLGITAKHSMETASAREADCFTTVSNITAEEASIVLGRTPDIVTPNGLDLRVIPDFASDRSKTNLWRKTVLARAEQLLKRSLPKETRIVLISGRYEFHNKGIDIFLEALANVNKELKDSQAHILALCTVMGGHSGINTQALTKEGGICHTAHHVHEEKNDAILSFCKRSGLDNSAENHVSVIFNPAQLNGNDGFFNMPYDQVLSSVDLGVFPSWYEPWGYTPEESIAYSVPTVTSDLAGFGLWVRNNIKAGLEESGVAIVPRRAKLDSDAVKALSEFILTLVSLPEDKLTNLRAKARQTATNCDWGKFFPFYLKAYNRALNKALEHGAHVKDAVSLGQNVRILAGSSSITPILHRFTTVTSIPKVLSRLRELAHNLWWSWHPDCWTLFSSINEELWESSGHSPIVCLESASDETFSELLIDPTYITLYKKTLAAFDEYMARPVQEEGEITAEHPIAYFSSEYGIHESLPIYSGGLGVLSGDHLKSSSDLNIPLVAIGLFYRFGYFRQQITSDARQNAIYKENPLPDMPFEQVVTKSGDPLEIAIKLLGRTLYARVWLVKVGTIRLYLLDSNLAKNIQEDRKVTDQLYVADRDCRVRQEILLGIGGVRLLEALGIKPSVYHMNEGHSAFLILERIRVLMKENGLGFAEAEELVRASCVFTAHTPVEAGNERFDPALIEKYFSEYAKNLGLDMGSFLATGHIENTTEGMYEMTVLALRHSHKANGVSRLHGDVSRHMWQGLWKGVSIAEVPIEYVTNGVHSSSYAAPQIDYLLSQYLGQDWTSLSPDNRAWYKLDSIPDINLWRCRQIQKENLLRYLAKKLPALYSKLGVSTENRKRALARISPDTLLIGFGRRFAPYKRANMLFADIEHLLRIISSEKQPVALLFAGKPHPADTMGIDIMQEILKHCIDERFLGRIFFLEDYSLAVSRLMLQGCDVWLNTPRRPLEASGTSGQKAAVNGILNLSISDGWWCEGYNGNNGWTIGPVVSRIDHKDTQSDYADSEALYSLLEDQIVPMYYFRNQDGIPEHWIKMVKNSMRSLIPMYSSNRMVSDYFRDYYGPTAKHYALKAADDYKLTKSVTAWKKDVASRFSSIQIGLLRIDGLENEICARGETIHVTLSLNAGKMTREELDVQLVIGLHDGNNFISHPDIVHLNYESTTSDGSLVYTCDYITKQNGNFAYGVRVMPYSPELASYLDTKLVIWA